MSDLDYSQMAPSDVNFLSAMTEHSQPAYPYILLKTDNGTVEKHVLAGSTAWTLGRDKDNSIVLKDTSISRHHAILQYLDSSSIYLIDLGSTNGSFVNQRRVSIPTLLQDGDQLTLGVSEIEFHHTMEADTLDPDSFSNNTDKTNVLRLRRLISVMVVDIRGFTQLAQQVDEKLLSQVLGDWFRRAGDIVRHHGSSVEKYIGDAVMAVWLHDEEEEKDNSDPSPDVLDAFRTICAMFEMTQELNRTSPLSVPLRIGAGINTGYAVVGQLGEGDRREYTVIGDSVNMAFRLESATRHVDADIAISKDTHSALWTHKLYHGKTIPQSFFRRQWMELKGYPEPQQVYHCHYRELSDFLHGSRA
ncbi:MAG: adenylate/guanylate cyclase domain-containing protein [Cyanobacteriota bacterium]|nr:adenylate/guanylate cyclase domain-containing protein [Cyanobacteriota bacterium]